MPDRFLVPGFSQSAAAWKEAAIGVSGIHLLDIPPAGSWHTTAEALAADRVGVWAGYSLGGRLALQIAVSRPHQVTGLLLVSATPGIIDPHNRAERRRADLELADWIEAHTVSEFLDRWLSQPHFAGRPRTHRLDDPRAIAAQLRSLGQGAQAPLWHQLHALTMPVVIVAGSKDEKYASIARRMADLIGDNARLHILPDCGHALLEEAPDEVRTLLEGV